MTNLTIAQLKAIEDEMTDRLANIGLAKHNPFVREENEQSALEIVIKRLKAFIMEWSQLPFIEYLKRMHEAFSGDVQPMAKETKRDNERDHEKRVSHAKLSALNPTVSDVKISTTKP